MKHMSISIIPDGIHVNQYLPLMKNMLISISPDKTHVNQNLPLMKHMLISIYLPPFYTTNPVFYTSGNRFVRRTGTFGNL
jgi:hypothetical protein